MRKRALRNGEPIFQTKGDALAAPDEPVKYSSILGKVLKVERNGATTPRCRDMESAFWRALNYLSALLSLSRARIRRIM